MVPIPRTRLDYDWTALDCSQTCLIHESYSTLSSGEEVAFSEAKARCHIKNGSAFREDVGIDRKASQEFYETK